MEEPINQRINKLIDKYCEGNNSTFARVIGTNEANIRNYLSGKSTPKLNVIIEIVNNFEISYEWLITGKGSMFLQNNENIVMEKSYTYKVSNKDVVQSLKDSLIASQKTTIKALELNIKLLKKEMEEMKNFIESHLKEKKY